MDYKKFLEAIAQIESSGGTNFDHKTMESGIHKGHQAIGRYGLMPNTVDELISSTEIELPLDLQQDLRRMSPQDKKSFLENNPDAENALAHAMAKKIGSQYSNDPSKMAYSWNQGHNIQPDDPRLNNPSEHEYVNKFLSAYQPAQSFRSPAMQTLSELEQKKQQFNKKYPSK